MTLCVYIYQFECESHQESEIVSNRIKLLVLGASGVGKTRLCERLREREGEGKTTVGAKFHSVVDLESHYMIWDISGHERFRVLISLYMKDTGMLWLVYKMTDSKTFVKLIELCREMLLPNKGLLKGPREMRVVIVGTHSKGKQDPPTNPYLGASGVGKTRLCERLREREGEGKTTVGAKFHSVVDLESHYMIWDISGHERFRVLISLYMKDTGMLWLVYKMTDSKTFVKLIELCREMLLPNKGLLKGPREMRVVIVGTHSKGKQDPPTTEERENLASLIQRLTLNKVHEVHLDSEVEDQDSLMRVVHPKENEDRQEAVVTFGQIQNWVTRWCRH